ncbi:hypothetical protein KIN20_036062 [Parelaphostrongylus tenuis]|uniref:Mos1 transposase HTH domain-containing protein n=1 Tax=Parelaphostrongylus tenuis TaxID=148309 RepID=A0AAD5RC14_PARTN|nr:hypothetical protein KIN20_036062 [Parelaphostrongylus tenuis]
MVAQRSLYRNLLFYEYELGCDAQTAFENVNLAKAQEFVPKRRVFWFYAEFRTGKTNMREWLCSGRPRKVDRDAVVKAIEEDLTLTIDDFDCGHATISKY